jgi:hypothetical protein
MSTIIAPVTVHHPLEGRGDHVIGFVGVVVAHSGDRDHPLRSIAVVVVEVKHGPT